MRIRQLVLLSEDTQEEPIGQVMTQDTTDSGTAEYSDQEAFEETPKFEEVEREHQAVNARPFRRW